MNTQLNSISKIFTETILRIPDYQRGYAWLEKQIQDFWVDIEQLEKDHNHYLGVLTLEPVPESSYKQWQDDIWIINSKKYTPYYVIDGQQRLTTVIILIQCIYEWCVSNSIDTLNYTDIQDIKKKFISESKDKGISQSYLFGYEKDNPSYEYLKHSIFNNEDHLQRQFQDTAYTSNLENAKQSFTLKLKNLTKEEVESIYIKTTQHLHLNIYSLSKDIDVHVAFETMNNRGKPLSHLELLKNRLIFLSVKTKDEESEKSKLRTTINETWKTIYHQLGRNKENLLSDDEFLSTHTIIYFNHKENQEIFIPDSRVHRRNKTYYQDFLLENHFTIKSLYNENINTNTIYNYAINLKSSIETWFNIMNPQQCHYNDATKIWLERVRKINSSNTNLLVMAIFTKEKDIEKRITFLQVLERSLFIDIFVRLQHISTSVSSSVQNMFDILLKNKETNTESVIRILGRHSTRILDFFQKEIQDQQNTSKTNYYKWRGIYYLLFEYNYYLMTSSKSKSLKLEWRPENDDDYLTIEHIYPQTDSEPYWQENFKNYTNNEKNVLKNTLGNLVPISQPKNASLGNRSFIEKKARPDSTIGLSYGSYVENEVAQNENWTAVEITKRGLKLLDFLESRWDINLGTNEQKIKFLGLDFVLEKEGPAFAKSILQPVKKSK